MRSAPFMRSLAAAIAVLFAGALLACQPAQIVGPSDDEMEDKGFRPHRPTEVIVEGEGTLTLYAQGRIPVGTVTLGVVGTDLLVRYESTGSWELVSAKLWLDSTLDSMPLQQRRPRRGWEFPYESGRLANDTTSHTITVPLQDFGGAAAVSEQRFYVAASAELRKEERRGRHRWQLYTEAWTEGERLVRWWPWATYFTYVFPQLGGGGGPATGPDEDAYARLARTFGQSLFPDGTVVEQWGWWQALGSDVAEPVTRPVYARAVDNNVAVGVQVGTLTYQYAAGTLTATFDFSASAGAWIVRRTAVYAANVAPTVEQLKPDASWYQHDLATAATSDTFTVSVAADSMVYFIAHALVAEVIAAP